MEAVIERLKHLARGGANMSRHRRRDLSRLIEEYMKAIERFKTISQKSLIDQNINNASSREEFCKAIHRHTSETRKIARVILATYSAKESS